MTKADLTETLRRLMPDRRKWEAEALVDAVLEQIKESLEAGEEVKIHGFGKFGLRHKAARRGRDPLTGGPLQLPARRVVTFKASRVLKRELNRLNGDAGWRDDGG